MDFSSLDDIVSMESKSNKTPSMDNTLLSEDDFQSKESTSNMTPPMDCLLSGRIAEELRLKKEEKVTQNLKSPQVVDHSREKRSRKVTKESMMKKAAENNSDRGNRAFKINSNQEEKKRKRKRKRAEVSAPVRELDNEFKDLITSKGGSLESLKLVIQKRLFESDVKREEGRLSIPQKKIISRFLEKEEDEYLGTRDGDKMNEKRVMLIDPSRQESKINLRKWFMNKDNGKEIWSYVLVTGWNEVVKRNALKAETLVQLWAFRAGTELWFALVKL